MSEIKRKEPIIAKLQRRSLGLQRDLRGISHHCVSIQSLMDTGRRLLGCIVLGFLKDGNHLISYSHSSCVVDEQRLVYHLQVWKFTVGCPCSLMYEIPLFQGGRSPSSEGLPEENFDEPLALRITICEPPNNDYLVVHGRPMAFQNFEDVQHHLSVIPSPALRAQQLEVGHYVYYTAAQLPFHGLLSMLPSDRILLPNGNRLQLIQIKCHVASQHSSANDEPNDESMTDTTPPTLRPTPSPTPPHPPPPTTTNPNSDPLPPSSSPIPPPDQLNPHQTFQTGPNAGPPPASISPTPTPHPNQGAGDHSLVLPATALLRDSPSGDGITRNNSLDSPAGHLSTLDTISMPWEAPSCPRSMTQAAATAGRDGGGDAGGSVQNGNDCLGPEGGALVGPKGIGENPDCIRDPYEFFIGSAEDSGMQHHARRMVGEDAGTSDSSAATPTSNHLSTASNRSPHLLQLPLIVTTPSNGPPTQPPPPPPIPAPPVASPRTLSGPTQLENLHLCRVRIQPNAGRPCSASIHMNCVIPWGFDPEDFIPAHLPETLTQSHRLTDYELQVVQTNHASQCSPTGLSTCRKQHRADSRKMIESSLGLVGAGQCAGPSQKAPWASAFQCAAPLKESAPTNAMPSYQEGDFRGQGTCTALNMEKRRRQNSDDPLAEGHRGLIRTHSGAQPIPVVQQSTVAKPRVVAQFHRRKRKVEEPLGDRSPGDDVSVSRSGDGVSESRPRPNGGVVVLLVVLMSRKLPLRRGRDGSGVGRWLVDDGCEGVEGEPLGNRAVMMVVDIAADDQAEATILEITELKLRRQADGSGATLVNQWDAGTIRQAAKFHAALLRKQFHIPCDPARTPLTLTNASVICTGRSLKSIQHPTLPLSITGYEATHQPRGY